jgi:cytochrome P450
MVTAQQAIPAHVPAHLVVDFDVYTAPELTRDPHRSAVERLHNGAPPIFYTPRNGGHWIVTRAEQALEMLRQPERFSSHPRYNVGLRRPRTLPNQADPPIHTEYRRVINPSFSPGSIKKMEEEIRELAISLIEGVKARGECDFVAEIGKVFPVIMFLRMAGAPLDDRALLVDLTETAVRDPDEAARNAASAEVGRYVMKVFHDRRDNPGDDLFSTVLRARIEGGRPLDDEELLGMGLLLLLGGLDTTSSMLSFIMLFLARNPGHYERVVRDRADLSSAVEELMRVHGVALFQRGVTDDFEHAGIAFRKNDRLYFLPQLFGVDDRAIDDPLRVDFDREVSHLAFGAGPHRCVGSHLARVEIRIFLEEWARAIPSYALRPGAEIPTCGGNVWSPLTLPLVWPARPAPLPR